ncbi:MBL fold metallo-hydrolase [Geodermatophilus sabuli]|uniref:Glyoxylase, beta-lactamase superfamily II n=1 Tax=Geodermatophilus sabuli TaxID=1564158 RepID=A0A285EE21_9ACTN|nr:MBL fold metallo-hydrolase [Geodermatophilus sabuli]MBB3084530.1 glyoxylase-like metal-dependent hydrolase (beta-lactamase superfamily II) [Geodermatophilus sabuli]SNX97275.1 Glyoxylase, beta-lactamase superfamily II [Geodermatophilus sabuli]
MTGDRTAPGCVGDVPYGGVTLLGSPGGGRYPSASSLLIRGTGSTVLVDPSTEVHRRGGVSGAVDLVAVSHAHEDHVAGLHLFPDVPVLAHPAEVGAIRSPEALLAGFGLGREEAAVFREELRDTFHLAGHQHVGTVEDGDVLDLGGRTVTVLHLPGHTAGHCGFLVEPDGFLFLADIDLTSFGPYYGDLSSSLEDFEASLARLREVEARWYGTAHHVGVLEGRPAFHAALDRFAAVIRRRDGRLLELLRQPRTLADVVARRLVYRPHVRSPLVDAVERRTALLHLERLERLGLVVATEGGYLAV